MTAKWIGLILVVVGLVLYLGACAPNQKSQEACNFVQNVYGQRISWKSKIPVLIYVSDSFPEEFVPVLERSIADWTGATGRPMFKYAGRTSAGSTARQDGKNVIYWSNGWDEKKSSEQALTSLFWVGDQVREADIRINRKDYSFYVSEALSPKDIHLESLITHELGHVLGLKHIDDSESVMETFLAPKTERVQLREVDKSSVSCEYS